MNRKNPGSFSYKSGEKKTSQMGGIKTEKSYKNELEPSTNSLEGSIIREHIMAQNPSENL